MRQWPSSAHQPDQAQLQDLRKAFRAATAEIRYLKEIVKRQSDALFAKHNHFLAMKGQPPVEKRTDTRNTTKESKARQAYLQKIGSWYFPNG